MFTDEREKTESMLSTETLFTQNDCLNSKKKKRRHCLIVQMKNDKWCFRSDSAAFLYAFFM